LTIHASAIDSTSLCYCCVERKSGRIRQRVKQWEIIADNLSKAGWSWGYVSAIASEGRTIWIVDAHRGDGKHFIVHADEKTNRVSGTRICESGIPQFPATPFTAPFNR
jgi:hypothetical protein